MYLDEIVSKAREECGLFLASQHTIADEHTFREMTSLLSTTAKTMVAIVWAAQMDRSMRPSIQLFAYAVDFKDGAYVGEKKVGYYLFPSGTIVRQSQFTCPQGCHEYGADEVEIDVPTLLRDVSAKEIARNISVFLEDPSRDLLEFAPSILN